MKTTVLEGGKQFLNSFKQILLTDLIQCWVLLTMSWIATLCVGRSQGLNQQYFKNCTVSTFITLAIKKEKKIFIFNCKKNFLNLSPEQNHILNTEKLFVQNTSSLQMTCFVFQNLNYHWKDCLPCCFMVLFKNASSVLFIEVKWSVR